MTAARGRAAVRAHRLRALAALAALLAACAHAPRQAPPAVRAAPATVLPASPPDLNAIGDAVPRVEPRSASGNPPFYDVAGHRYVVLASERGYVERGVASWYGTEFHGLRTSTGETYDMFAMTAAHKTLPLPCYARVTNLANGRSVVVRINDRGPFVANRIIDLSYTAAAKLDMIRSGTAFVQVETLSPGPPAESAAVPVTTPAATAANVGLSSVPALESPAPGPVAAPPAATAMPGAPPVAAVPPAGPRFYIQVGAYGHPENARRVLQQLRAAGLEATLAPAGAGGTALQRVRIGPIGSVEQFDQLIARLGALGFPDARLAQE